MSARLKCGLRALLAQALLIGVIAAPPPCEGFGGMVAAGHPSGLTQRTVYSGFQIPIMSTPTDSAVFIRPYQFLSEVGSFKLHFANKYATGNVGNSLVSNITVYAWDSGASNYCGTLLADFQAQTIPGDGTEWVSSSISLAGVASNKVAVVYSIPLNTGSDNLAWGPLNNHGYFLNHSTTTNPAPVPTDGASQDGAFWIHVEYKSTKRRFVALGDSLSIASTNGPDATLTGGYEASPYYQLGLQKNVAVDIEGYGGALLSERAAYTTNPNLWTYPVTVDDVIIALGTNDEPSGATAMETSLQALITHIQSLAPTARIWAETVAPNAYYFSSDAQRITYNADLRSNFAGWGITGLIDYETALWDPANHTQLLAAYTVEGTHLTPAGNAAALTALEAGLGL